VTAALVAGLLAGYGIAVPVGAVATYLVALTARTSLRIGACAALGVATADGLYALIAQIGGTALAHALEPVLLPLRWASATILIALAVRSSLSALALHRNRRQPTPIRESAPVSPARAYLGLWAATMLNPLTMIYFAALVIGTQSRSAPDHRPADRLRGRRLHRLGKLATPAGPRRRPARPPPDRRSRTDHHRLGLKHFDRGSRCAPPDIPGVTLCVTGSRWESAPIRHGRAGADSPSEAPRSRCTARIRVANARSAARRSACSAAVLRQW
jgi:threonine/homoserine/homoserine lactone efflux protein